MFDENFYITYLKESVGIAFSSHGWKGYPGAVNIIKLSDMQETKVGNYRVRIDRNVYREIRAWIKQNSRIRSRHYETGGLLWGFWDDAVGIVWVFDVSGPPPDSLHDPGQFICGVEGTIEEHERRVKQSYGACGFIGFWHTHPSMTSGQSITDMTVMSELVSKFGQNQKKALMLIFGHTRKNLAVGVYLYESQAVFGFKDIILVGQTQITQDKLVV